jgi:hypothetical protein
MLLFLAVRPLKTAIAALFIPIKYIIANSIDQPAMAFGLIPVVPAPFPAADIGKKLTSHFHPEEDGESFIIHFFGWEDRA